MINPNYLRLAAQLLKLASEEFSNHGCNDFELPEWMSKAERLALSTAMCEANGDPLGIPSDSDLTFDYALMGFLASVFEEQAGKPPTIINAEEKKNARLRALEQDIINRQSAIAAIDRGCELSQRRRQLFCQGIEEIRAIIVKLKSE